MTSGRARELVVVSMIAAGAVIVVGGAVRGKLPSSRRLLALGIVYVGLAGLADVVPDVGGPMAVVAGTGIVLWQGEEALRGVRQAATSDKPAGTDQKPAGGILGAAAAIVAPATGTPAPSAGTGVLGGIGTAPRYCGAQPVSGGDGGDWAGSKPRCEAWAALSGLCCSSSKRATRLTASGGVSDHWTGSTRSYATDLPTTPPAGDEPARIMAAAIGVQGYTGGRWLNVTIDGYRYQLGWRVEDHFDHIHAGVKRVG